MLETAGQILKWIAVVIGCIVAIYLALFITRYEQYRKSNIRFDLELPPLTAFAHPNA